MSTTTTTTGAPTDDLFTAVISDIKTYTGRDPLLPWLRGIRKMKDSLSPHLLREKLPRFLQKCAQAFESDRRYANDLRYLRVWLQLMDFVDDPKALLSTMEEKRIGMKKSLFYQAYALYYEKNKKFEKADMMYHLGVQHFAEPLDELKKSYEQFLERMERNNRKKTQRQQKMAGKGILRVKSHPPKFDDTRKENEKTCEVHSKQSSVKNHDSEEMVPNGMPVRESNPTTSYSSIKKTAGADGGYLNQQYKAQAESYEHDKFGGEDTVVGIGRFVDTAIVGKSEAEDACHHGLVEPTINTKEALNAINSMFREPLDPTLDKKRSNRSQAKPKVDQRVDGGFEVFIDESTNNSSNPKGEKGVELPLQESFHIYVDNESDDVEERDSGDDSGRGNAFVFPTPKDFVESSSDFDVGRSSRSKLREDTVVRRFVGAAISDEPKVENVCHHGLLEPTINTKEAMDDINSMFGKPIENVRTTRPKRLEKVLNCKNKSSGFVILPDLELDHQRETSKSRSIDGSGSDLFEPTVCTKEALDDINKMFAMPLDF